MNTFIKMGLLVLVVLCVVPVHAGVVPPRGTCMTGVIQSVDHASRWIVFAQNGGPVRRFVYSQWAKFWHDAIEASPDRLKPGMKIRVDFHNPFFGPDFVRRIELLEPTNGAGGKNPK